MDVYIEHVLCHTFPDRTILMAKSSENIFGFPAAMLVSHSTDPIVTNLVSSRMRNSIELGLFKGANQVIFPDVSEKLSGIQKSMAGFQCVDLLKGAIAKSMDSEWSPLPFHFFIYFFFICAIIIVISLIVLILEMLLFKLISLIEE